MAILYWWREIIISFLVISCLWLINGKQELGFELRETQLIHEKLIADQNAANAQAISKVNEERKIETEVYAIEINRISGMYADLANRNSRMHTEIKTYTDRLHTVSREAVETYAKAASTVYGECRTEYVTLGRYAAEIDAELDKVTKTPQ